MNFFLFLNWLKELIGMGNAGPMPIVNSWLCGTTSGNCAPDNDTVNRASRDAIMDRGNMGFSVIKLLELN